MSTSGSVTNMGKPNNALMIYVIIVILYLEIFLFMFNTKIKNQILFCAVPVTIILFTVILKNAIGDNVKLYYKIAGLFIGIMTIITCIGILNTAITEYKTDVKSSDGETVDTKLSKDNANTVKNIRIVFITNVIITTIMGFIIDPNTANEIILIKGIFEKIAISMNIDKIPTTYDGMIDTKNAIIDFINSMGNTPLIYLLYTIVFILSPLGLIASMLKRIADELTKRPNHVFNGGIVYILSTSIYIIVESTRLSRLVIPE